MASYIVTLVNVTDDELDSDSIRKILESRLVLKGNLQAEVSVIEMGKL